MHALEILFSELQGYCNPIREYKVLTCSHPCQRLGACTAACSPGQSPGWRVQVAAPEPSFCQAGQGGHLWNLHRHTAALFSRSTSPGPGIPLSSGSSPGFFSLSTIFGCCPLDQSSRCQILRCLPDILSIVDLLPWELSQERCRFFITCQCPCFVLSRKTHVPLITSNPWPCAWNETIASSHTPNPRAHVLLTGDRFWWILYYEFTGARDRVSPRLAVQRCCRHVTWLSRGQKSNKDDVPALLCALLLFHSSSPAQVLHFGGRVRSSFKWLARCISQRILSLTCVTGFVSM